MVNTTKEHGGTQLPDDVVAQGYKETRPFHHEQVFYSATHAFTGTEQEFINAGIAYRYRQSGFKRWVESGDKQ